MAVRQKDGQWQVEFQQRGTRIYRRLPPLATRDQAVALETKLRRELTDQTVLGKKPVVALDAAIQLWLEATLAHRKDKSVTSKARSLAPFVLGRTLVDVPGAAQEAVATWSGTLQASTINRRLCVLKAVSKYAWRQGWIAENLSPRIQQLPEHNKREVYLTPTQVTLLAKSATSATIKAAIYIAGYTGLRVSELLRLPKVTTRQGSLLVEQSKTGKPRAVPIVPLLRPYLSALPLGITYDQLHKQFLAAAKKANMPHVRFHDLRHTFASMLINKGVDLYTVGKLLGHTTTQTTARYAHLADKQLRAAMRRIA